MWVSWLVGGVGYIISALTKGKISVEFVIKFFCAVVRLVKKKDDQPK